MPERRSWTESCSEIRVKKPLTDAQRAKQKAWRAAHYQKNKPLYQKYNRAWRKKNPASAKAIVRRWRKKNRDKVKEYRKLWIAKNPERERERNKRQTARRLSTQPESFKKASRKWRDKLPDSYVIQTLIQRAFISRDQITPELIALQRAHILLVRELKKSGTA